MNTFPDTFLTVIHDQSLCKTFDINENGLKKISPTPRSQYAAEVMPLNLYSLANLLKTHQDITLICGYPVLNGTPIHGPVTLYSKGLFKETFPEVEPPLINTIDKPDGTQQIVCTRTKDVFSQSDIILFDVDLDGRHHPICRG